MHACSFCIVFSLRMIILHNVERYLNAKTCLNKVIYDNDEVLNGSWTPPDPDLLHAALQFDARFECGNLRKVVWVSHTIC